jgi:hypothetical protein
VGAVDHEVQHLLKRPDLPANAEGFSATPQAVAVSVTALYAFAAKHGLPESGLERRLDEYVESIGGERLKLVDLDKLVSRTLKKLFGRRPQAGNTDMYYLSVKHVADRFGSRPPGPLPQR